MKNIAELEALLCCHLKKDYLGIWVDENIHEEIHYPDNAHGACFQVENASVWFAHRNKCIASMLHVYPSDGLLLDVGGEMD